MNNVGSVASKGLYIDRILSPCSVRWEFGARPRVVDVRGYEDFERAKEVMGRLMESDRPGDIVVKYENEDALEVAKFVGELIRRQNEFKHPIEMLSYGEVEVLKPLSEKVLEDFKGLPEAIKPKALWALKVLGRLLAMHVYCWWLLLVTLLAEQGERLWEPMTNPLIFRALHLLCVLLSGLTCSYTYLVLSLVEKSIDQFNSNNFLLLLVHLIYPKTFVYLLNILHNYEYTDVCNWVPTDLVENCIK